MANQFDIERLTNAWKDIYGYYSEDQDVELTDARVEQKNDNEKLYTIVWRVRK